MERIRSVSSEWRADSMCRASSAVIVVTLAKSLLVLYYRVCLKNEKLGGKMALTKAWDILGTYYSPIIQFQNGGPKPLFCPRVPVHVLGLPYKRRFKRHNMHSNIWLMAYNSDSIHQFQYFHLTRILAATDFASWTELARHLARILLWPACHNAYHNSQKLSSDSESVRACGISVTDKWQEVSQSRVRSMCCAGQSCRKTSRVMKPVAKDPVARMERITEHQIVDPCRIKHGSSSVLKSWSLALEKKDSCAAEGIAHLLAHEY